MNPKCNFAPVCSLDLGVQNELEKKKKVFSASLADVSVVQSQR